MIEVDAVWHGRCASCAAWFRRTPYDGQSQRSSGYWRRVSGHDARLLEARLEEAPTGPASRSAVLRAHHEIHDF
ncbi:MAG: hypothetical protein WA688_09345 [Thermoplasmata archaeon]